MCEECGCGSVIIHNDHKHSYTDAQHHEHSNAHECHHNQSLPLTNKVMVEKAVLDKNDRFAAINRQIFSDKKIYAINLISSPGSGKTTIVEALARHFGEKMVVIVGDIQTRRDADRARAAGCRSAQIETLGACHLDAHSILHTLESFDLNGVRLLIIENVGNLVCPSSYDLGENEVVAVLSAPEGDDKVLKYPTVFHRASTLILNKMDLSAFVNFDKEKVISECRSLNKNIGVFETAAINGQGMDLFIDYLSKRCGIT
ncbi:MAG: hydrogenase nickel incorporation protein HypB [Fibrobacter sp.]|nr:hydrogenase nickel incorporation protein HypB [Fibrobacter sp.]